MILDFDWFFFFLKKTKKKPKENTTTGHWHLSEGWNTISASAELLRESADEIGRLANLFLANDPFSVTLRGHRESNSTCWLQGVLNNFRLVANGTDSTTANQVVSQDDMATLQVSLMIFFILKKILSILIQLLLFIDLSKYVIFKTKILRFRFTFCEGS